MSTPPTSRIPSTKPSLGARLTARARAYYEKATVHSDNSNRAFAMVVFLGAVAVIVTGLILWAETTGEYAANTFIATGTTTLAVAVVVQATILFFLARVKPTVAQIVTILLLVIFVKWPMGWIYTAFGGLFSKGWWAVPFIGFIAFWVSMVLLFVLIFKITAPQVDNPELVDAKTASDTAAAKRDKRQRDVDNLTEKVAEATETEKKSAQALIDADAKFEKMTRKRGKCQDAHDAFVKDDETVTAAEKELADATEALRVSLDTSRKAKESYKQATERKKALPSMISQRQGELTSAQTELNNAVAKVAAASVALRATPSDVVAKTNYTKALSEETATQRRFDQLSAAITKLTDEEIDSDSKVQALLDEVPKAQADVEAHEKLVKAAEKVVEDTRKELNEKTPTGAALVKAKKKEDEKREVADKAKATSDADTAALDLATSKAQTAGNLLTKANEDLEKKKITYTEVSEGGAKAQKKRWGAILLTFVTFVATNVAIYGYVLTQH